MTNGQALPLRPRVYAARRSSKAPEGPESSWQMRNGSIRLRTRAYIHARNTRQDLSRSVLLHKFYLIRPTDCLARSPMCFKCIRFRKNALKERSALFNWLDSYLNPMFNRVRDSLLTIEELDNARALARRAADRDFIDYEQ
jgi:hypothetical protein